MTRLSRVGFDHTLGYLKGGFKAWKSANKDFDTITSIPANEFKSIIEKDSSTSIFDVRNFGEFSKSHIATAKHTALSFLNDHLSLFPNQGLSYLHCAGGYRSVIAISILKSRGIHNLVDIAGGFKAIKEAKIKITDEVCPSTLK